MKVTNKTEVYVNYANELFAPKETKEIDDKKVYVHRDFDIDEGRKKIEKVEKKPKKKKGGKR